MGASRPSEKAQKKTSMKVLPRLVGALVLVMILAPEGLAAQDAIATALDRIHREYSSSLSDFRGHTERASLVYGESI